MTNQEILNYLSTLECALYYRADGHDNPEGVSEENTRKVHDLIDEAMNLWYDLTGCTI